MLGMREEGACLRASLRARVSSLGGGTIWGCSGLRRTSLAEDSDHTRAVQIKSLYVTSHIYNMASCIMSYVASCKLWPITRGVQIGMRH